MKDVEPGQVWQDCDTIVVTLYPRPDVDASVASERWRFSGTWQCLIVSYEPDYPEMLGCTSSYSVADERSGWKRLL